jgi:hypothetical protein
MRHLFGFVFAAIVSACVPAGGGYPSTYPQPSYAQETPAGYPQPAASDQATAAYGTGVFINGELLTAEQKAELDALLGEAIPAGRYALDAQYNFGYEGQAPVINLKAYVAERQRAAGGAQAAAASESSESGKPFSMYSRDSAGQGSSLVSDGNGCMIMSTPTGSLSSGC